MRMLLPTCMTLARARRARHPLPDQTSRRAGDAIRIWCPGELWRIAMGTLFWCRIRQCRAWKEIYLLGAMG